MRFSLDWLKKHLNTNYDVAKISEILTSIGLEVESAENFSRKFENFSVTEVKSVEKHPNADRLHVCKVTDASGVEFQIVCGASNVRKGLKTILAHPGALIPETNTVLKKSKIRGVYSEGMLCSSAELMLKDRDTNGIIELDPDTDLSTKVVDVLNLPLGVIDISITPNRGDCFSIRGVARDLAAKKAGSLVPLEEFEAKGAFELPIKIHYAKNEGCKAYAPTIAFRVIRGLKNKPLPNEIKAFLESAEINSISPIVDISNFFMFDFGRPLHIYDLKKIKGDVHIRFAYPGEKFIALNGEEYILQPDMLVSADDEGPLCLMGVMGSKRCACSDETTDILIESGWFAPEFISRTGNFLNIMSDARARFERGIDRDSCVPGLEFVTKYYLDLCGGSASKIFLISEGEIAQKLVELRSQKLNSIAGVKINWQEAKEILNNLGIKEAESTDDGSKFIIPGWRSDLLIEEDLIGEVLRIHGYGDIDEKKIDPIINNEDILLNARREILSFRKLFASHGLSEIVSYSFIKQEYATLFKEDSRLIYVLNPISTDMAVMRPSLLPNLLSSALRSFNYGEAGVSLFEIGNVFLDSGRQEPRIAILRSGVSSERSWLEVRRDFDVFDIKADVMDLLEFCNIPVKDIMISTEKLPSFYHPSRAGRIVINGRTIGYFGELHPKITKAFSISKKVVCAQLCIAEFFSPKKRSTEYYPKIFPKISRDFSVVFDAKQSIGNLINDILRLNKCITNVGIFDCFYLEDGQKSIGINVLLDGKDRTLTEEEAQEISDGIIKIIEASGGELRKK